LQSGARPPALAVWYEKAVAEVQAVYRFVSLLAVE